MESHKGQLQASEWYKITNVQYLNFLCRIAGHKYEDSKIEYFCIMFKMLHISNLQSLSIWLGVIDSPGQNNEHKVNEEQRKVYLGVYFPFFP